MVRVSHDLEIIDFAERDVDGQLVEQRRRGVGRIGLVSNDGRSRRGLLRMREIGNRRIRQGETRSGGVGIARLLGSR